MPGKFGESGMLGRGGSGMPPMLQRLMSNPGPGVTVEEIERQHRGEIPRDQMPKPAGAEAPCTSINGAIISQSISTSLSSKTANVPAKSQPTTASSDEPQSPNTLLKQTLKIGSKVPSSSSSICSDSDNKSATYPLASLADFGQKLSSVVESQGSDAAASNSNIHSTMSASAISTYAHTEPLMRSQMGQRQRSSPTVDAAAGGRGMGGLLPVGAEDTLGPRPTSAGSSSSLVTLDLSQVSNVSNFLMKNTFEV